MSTPKDRAALLAELNRAMREVSGQGVLFSQTVADHLGVGGADLECLDLIVMRGPVTAGELARATGLTTGAITGVIDRLERAGFAMREADPGDRRKVLVKALPAMLERAAPLYGAMAEATSAALAVYDDSQLTFLLEFLHRIHAAAVTATNKLRSDIPVTVRTKPKLPI